MCGRDRLRLGDELVEGVKAEGGLRGEGFIVVGGVNEELAQVWGEVLGWFFIIEGEVKGFGFLGALFGGEDGRDDGAAGDFGEASGVGEADATIGDLLGSAVTAAGKGWRGDGGWGNFCGGEGDF